VIGFVEAQPRGDAPFGLAALLDLLQCRGLAVARRALQHVHPRVRILLQSLLQGTAHDRAANRRGGKELVRAQHRIGGRFHKPPVALRFRSLCFHAGAVMWTLAAALCVVWSMLTSTSTATVFAAVQRKCSHLAQ